MSGYLNYELNRETWYTDRHLSFCPAHFVRTNTRLTLENLSWIYEKLHGRFYISKVLVAEESGRYSEEFPFFEDPQEAIHYELVWS